MNHDRFEYSPIIKRAPLRWPNGARLALWIIPNIEYHEFDGPGVGVNPAVALPDILNYGWRDYSLRVGVWRFMALMDKFGLRGTVALNANVCDFYPQIIEEGLKRNWEFMGHGLTNSQLLAGLPEEKEREVVRETVEKIKKATGQAPRGWLGPALAETPRTPDILAENGISYVCDWCNDDQPYPMRVKKGRLISVPYSIEINDIPFFVGKGATPEQFRQAIQDQFDVLYEEGKETGKVMAIALHPFITSAPHRHKSLEAAIAYVTRHRDVWFTTGGEIADWYYKNYYKD
ncbi:MAG: polysaccharide deacetylase family protein [Candidatus Binataceae bacterium]